VGRGSAIAVSVLIDVAPDVVWADLRDIPSHVEWMTDAVAIRFRTPQREGVGTSFDCETRVGPIRLTDHMVVTAWEPGSVIGVRHTGAVRGQGRFILERSGPARSRLTWTERLSFPWWLGGRIGAAVGGPVLSRIWTRNLDAFRARLTAAPPAPG